VALTFDTPLSHARHVDGAREKLLKKLSLETVYDLLMYAPFRYIDLSNLARIGNQLEGDITVSGEVVSVQTKRPRPKLQVTEVALTDGSGTVLGVWFNQPWVETVYKVGDRCAFSGTMTYQYGMRRMAAPFVQKLGVDDEAQGRVFPVYRLTEGLSQGWMRRIVIDVLADTTFAEEILPDELRVRHRMRTLEQALHDVHAPTVFAESSAARNRLAYQEFFELSVLKEMQRRSETVERVGYAHTVTGSLVERGIAALGVTLTDEQTAALDRIWQDMAAPVPMQRLLLGDVGTGKTFVAAGALFAAAESGTQAAMMAPTEILALQYAEKLGPILDEVGIAWRVLVGATKEAERREILTAVREGECCVVFGTHALMQPEVEYANLTLAIIDEQHRFGVDQRKALTEKAVNPDVLVMTATPIPRSLALTIYGDLAVTLITKRPIEGAGVTTHLIHPANDERAHRAVKDALKAGRQAYIVCALIESSTKVEARAATELAEKLAKSVYRDYRVGLLHGSLPVADKEEVMRRFRAGELDVLVATTVIEVGVDVQNVTEILIYNAERFGLAQLHQLRGRVGRGEHPGEAWLISEARAPRTRQRLEALKSTTDGFRLAEVDLEIRGPGEVMGTRQHGLAEFRVAHLVEDLPILELAKADAAALVAADPTLAAPTHRALNARIEELRTRYASWVSAG